MKSLKNILEGIFDIDNNMNNIDWTVFIERIKRANGDEARIYDELWNDVLSNLIKNAKRVDLGDLYKLLKKSNKKYIVIHRDMNGYISNVIIFEGASRYPKIRTFEKGLRSIYLEYHIDLMDGYNYNDNDECYYIPKEYDWLFEIKIK